MTVCYLCGSDKNFKREGSLRDYKLLDILECRICGLVFLSSFSHISDEFYSELDWRKDKVNIEKLVKSTKKDDERRYKDLKNELSGKSVLDFGCGTGEFLKLSLQVSDFSIGIEVEKNLKNHHENLGVRVFENLSQLNQKFDVITLFHVLEHFKDPISLLKNLSLFLKKKGQIIIEVPNSGEALLSLFKEPNFSKFIYWGCHLFMFNRSCLYSIFIKSELSVNYIKQIQRYSLSNHLYWMSNGKPGGHEYWWFLDSDELNKQYEISLGKIDSCDTLFSSVSL